MNTLQLVLLLIMGSNVDSLPTLDSDTELTLCVSYLVNELFGNDTTFYFIFENLKSFPFLQSTNPKIVVNIASSLKLSWKFHYNYVLYTNGHESLNEMLRKLKGSPIWNISESPRGRFLIISFSSSYTEKMFNILWEYDIINAIVVTFDEESSPKICTSDPFEDGNKCGNQANIIFTQPCNINSRIGFNKTIKNLKGCSLKIPLWTVKLTIKQSVATYVIYNQLKFIGKLLNTENVTGFVFKNEILDHYNRTNGILFSYGLSTGVEVTADYDLTEMLFFDELIWVVPKATKIFGFRVFMKIYEIHAWLAIGVTLIVMIITWWLLGSYGNDQNEFWRSFLAIIRILLCGADNLPPKSNALKFLALSFSIYCIVIVTSFNANLISVMTKPLEEGITTVEQLAESNLSLLMQGSNEFIHLKDAYGEKLFNKLQKRFIVTLTADHEKVLKTLVLYRNVSDMMTRTMLKKSGWQGEVDSFNAKIIPLICTFYMRKGHFIIPTFNKLVRKVFEYGFYEQIIRHAYNQDKQLMESSDTALSFIHLSSNFILWGVGLLIATVVFIIELYSSRNSRKY